MANDEHVAILKKGVDAWNAWRNENTTISPDLSGADLIGAKLSKADLSGANLAGADLSGADLSGADLFQANLSGANLSKAKLTRMSGLQVNFRGANLSGAMLDEAFLIQANLTGANLSKTNLFRANLGDANLQDANLAWSSLMSARLSGADLRRAALRPAVLSHTDLTGANLSDVDLSEDDLERSLLIETDVRGASLNGCRVYGTSVWNVKTDQGTKQRNLIITALNEPEVSVDNIEVAQFVYLLLNNAKIRDVIDTIGKKGVLLLGRFTEGRIDILKRLREELRNRDYLPIIFNFDKPETKNFTETVRLLAGLSHFVIADVTNPKSAPLELQATVPEVMVPFRPIIQEGEKPFAMLEDLWIQHREWVFEPLYYSSLDALVGALDEKIIKPANARFAELLARKAEKMKGEHV